MEDFLREVRKWNDRLLLFLAIIISALVIIGLISAGYRVDWTGFNSQKGLPAEYLWDWLQLLIIPLVLAVGGYLFNLTVSRNEREIAQDAQREATLQEYINKMSELLLERKLRQSAEDDEVRKIARVRTLTVLLRLDGERKSSVLQFLHESGLIEKDKCIIDLEGADLSEAILRYKDLRGADLRGAILGGADLYGADLNETNLERVSLYGADLQQACLQKANLSEANMRGANLRGADLSGANLNDTIFSLANLQKANLRGSTYDDERLSHAKLQGATMTDGSKHT